MIPQKVRLIGGFAVGKTSLDSRFVHSLFSGKYHTTIGVSSHDFETLCNGH